MRAIGYGDAWIRYMRAVHDPNTKTLITHEVEQRALDMGKEVDACYQNNDLFRHIFPEILPSRREVWNDSSKYHRRDPNAPADATTGTYTYRGVGQSIQGIHPKSTIQDDNFGKAAQASMLNGDGRVVDDLIRWHQQLSTRLEYDKSGRPLGRQLVIGNRWGHADLNSWIRQNQKHFQFETHDAEGGCCLLHPANTPVFPEELGWSVLKQKRADLTAYDYHHFYRNVSILPEECIFQRSWLREFRFKQSAPDLDVSDPRNILLIEHTVADGVVIEDLQPGSLTIVMLVDLAHAKKMKRCDHCILVVGFDPESGFIYMLDLWAEPSPYSELVSNIYRIARRWNLHSFWLETVAAQNILKFYLEERNQREVRPLDVLELPYDNSENAKKNRIEALEPVGRDGQIWVHPSMQKFIRQWESYPAGLVDVLDTLGYVLKILDVGVSKTTLMQSMSEQYNDFVNRVTGGAGGY